MRVVARFANDNSAHDDRAAGEESTRSWLMIAQTGALLCRDQIKFSRRFLVEQRALFLIAAAPVLVSSGNT